MMNSAPSKVLPDFFTVNEFALRWKVSSRFIRKLIQTGQLTPVRMHRAVRLPLKDVLLIEARGGV